VTRIREPLPIRVRYYRAEACARCTSASCRTATSYVRLCLGGAFRNLISCRPFGIVARFHAHDDAACDCRRLQRCASHVHTKWTGFLQWTSGHALTPVDSFNASPGQIDPFLNCAAAPIPRMGLLPAHMEALLDLHICWLRGMCR